MCYLRVICAEGIIGENNRRGNAVMQIEKRPDTPVLNTVARAPTLLNAGSPTRDIPCIAKPQIALSEIQFGARSDFGFHKPFRFFDLPASRPESPTTGFGIGSVGVGVR